MVSILLAVVLAVILAAVVFLVMLFYGRERATRLELLQKDHERLLPFEADNERLKVENATLLRQVDCEQAKTRWVETAETQLKDTFNSLAADALKGNSAQFIDQSKHQIDSFVKQLRGDWDMQKETVQGIMEPLNKDLEKLQQQVQGLETKREGAYSSMLTQVGDLIKTSKELGTATTRLHEALKSSTTRGAWGQLSLRRIAELAGLVDHIDFDEQVTTDSGSRPDMIIHLPNQGVILVDAKAPMDAYMRAIEATSPEESVRHLNDHRLAMRGHVKSLSKKSYWAEFERSAEFVVMFVPYESGLEASFSQDPDLLQDALENKVVVVSPSTLLALLKVIAYGWLQLQLAKNAQDIADQGKELMERFATFLGHLRSLGTKLDGSLDAYNDAVGSLDKRLMPSIKKLKDMGTFSDELPEVKHLENKARLPDAIGSGGNGDENSKRA